MGRVMDKENLKRLKLIIAKYDKLVKLDEYSELNKSIEVKLVDLYKMKELVDELLK